MLFPLQPNDLSRRTRVVVTGAGIVSSLGVGWEVNASGFQSGRSAFRPVSLFDVSRHRVKVAGEVDLPSCLPRTLLTAREEARLDRSGRLLLHATHEAWTQAGWRPQEPLPLVLGTTSGGMSLGETYYRGSIADPVSQKGQPSRVVNYQVQQQAIDLANAFGFSGPVTIISNACSSGANAIGQAYRLVRTGQSSAVLTGGYDALCQLVFAGFDSLQALSPTTCRPFDANRDGLALGEGAAMLCLESLESAASRGARILGEVVGYGAANDTHHLTQPHPEGDAALLSMNAAMRDAGLVPGEIDYINAHGTGTPLNDIAESHAINRWAGAEVGRIPVTSTKASIGHLLGAAGAVEVVVCLMALEGQWIPPATTLNTPDPSCQFPIPRQPERKTLRYALTNSFGFGGANATVILGRAP